MHAGVDIPTVDEADHVADNKDGVLWSWLHERQSLVSRTRRPMSRRREASVFEGSACLCRLSPFASVCCWYPNQPHWYPRMFSMALVVDESISHRALGCRSKAFDIHPKSVAMTTHMTRGADLGNKLRRSVTTTGRTLSVSIIFHISKPLTGKSQIER